MIYLDYNATTPISPEVVAEMRPWFDTSYGNPSSAYAIGRTSKDAIYKARKQVARLLNARPEEIVFTSGATESNNLAIQGFVLANKEKGKHIITSAVEHPAVLEVCKHLATRGYEITCLPVNALGRVDPADVEKAIRPDTVLISIMHANNEVGTIQAISEIATIAKKNRIAFHTDAAQSPGKIEVDVQQLGVDLLTIAGHKMYAPKGIGALYIRQGVKIENLFHGASQEKGIRPGTENVPYIVGLGKACELAQQNLTANSTHLSMLRDQLLRGLQEKLGTTVKVNAELSSCLPNTLSVAFEKIEAHTLASIIEKEVCISTGSACHADSIEISPVLTAMNIDRLTAASTVRISLGKPTTEEEIIKAIEIITKAVNQLKK
ncbi:cysteine desulfurase family protein [Roseimarinus sediminis]|uniref:cysteine desulfurase family protein n=1 Tax=Roseimarinus sediminis TaxID=1610899 RepID=UPI003D21AAE3